MGFDQAFDMLSDDEQLKSQDFGALARALGYVLNEEELRGLVQDVDKLDRKAASALLEKCSKPDDDRLSSALAVFEGNTELLYNQLYTVGDRLSKEEARDFVNKTKK